METSSQNVTVCVRVRPINERERKLDTSCVISMSGNQTTIDNHRGRAHSFFYDQSFNSMDRDSPEYASQDVIFGQIGMPLLDRCLEGYNCCLFAYGQTSSGKSYSMMGSIAEPGVTPRFCAELFSRIDAWEAEDPSIRFKVEVSYFEIYSERIYDLLLPEIRSNKSKLKVREHPILGPYVENLTAYAATCFEDIDSWISLGDTHRATASTNMNMTSSRSHAVFAITVTQIQTVEDDELSKVSRVNLVDLAGSERSDAAGTSGLRLREGSAINKSLHTLGKVISLLSERQDTKKNIFIPYRDSVLTWILKESLGGNAKTTMLATVSPAIENYDESLSTLRYAHEARSIVNDARVNEDPTTKLIRELRSEIELLRSRYGMAKGEQAALLELQELKEKLNASHRLMEDFNRSWEEKLQMTKRMQDENIREMESQGVARDLRKIDNRQPNLVNLNEDPQLSEMLIYILKTGVTMIGCGEGADVQLGGALVQNRHATITCGDTITLRTIGDAAAFVNGSQCMPEVEIELHHGDRIVIASSHYFRLNVPRTTDRKSDGLETTRDYKYARDELERVQTARIEAEIEAEYRAKMDGLEQAHNSAQQRLLQQQADYETKLKVLEQSQAEIVAAERLRAQESLRLATQSERDRAMKAIEERSRELLDKHLQDQAVLDAEKEKSRLQLEEEAAIKNTIIRQLEDEKRKIEADVASLKDVSLRRKQAREELLNLTSNSSSKLLVDAKKGEWLRVSVLIKEANAISVGLNQNTVFQRIDSYHDEKEAQIRLINTLLNIETTWSLEKFEARLEQMREIYYAAEKKDLFAIGEAVRTLFYDPNDDWQQELDITSTPLLRAQVLRNHMMSRRHTTYDVTPSPNPEPTTPVSRKYSEFTPRSPLVEGAKGRRMTAVTVHPTTLPPPEIALQSPAKKAAPVVAPKPPKATSVAHLCSEYLKNSLALLNREVMGTPVNDIVDALSSLKAAVGSIYSLHAASQKEAPMIFVERGTVRDASLSATMSTQLLCTTVQAYRREYAKSEALEDLVTRLANVTATTASNLVKLFKGLEGGIENMVTFAHSEIMVNISSISSLAGELAVATQKTTEEVEEGGEVDDEYVKRQEQQAESTRISRMVTDDSLDSSRTIDDDILMAFQRGTFNHVERSMENYAKEMKTRFEEVQSMTERVSSKSNLNSEVLHDTSIVIQRASEVLATAHKLQAALADRMTSSSAETAKITYYRKTFTKARGCINEVNELADATALLTDSCARAVAGDSDIEQVMSNVKNLKTSITQLLTETKVKFTSQSQDHYEIFDDLQQQGSESFKMIKELSTKCDTYSSSDQARSRRANWSRAISATKKPTFSKSPSSQSESASKGSPGSVRRKFLVLEQQANILRLQKEIEAAQKELASLNQKAYSANDATTYI